MMLLLLDVNFNLLRIIDYSDISIQGVFKIWDIFIIIITIHYFATRRKINMGSKEYLLSKYILFLTLFIIIYIIYTPAYAGTSTLLESFKMGRKYLYIILFFVFLHYLNEEIIYKFWLFYKFVLITGGMIYILAYFGISTTYFGIEKWEGSFIIRNYLYCPNTGMLLSLYYLLQKIINYEGKFKITTFEFLIIVMFTIASMARNLWISYIVALLIIFIISSFKFSFRLTLSKQAKYLTMLIILSFILVSVTTYSGSGSTFMDRIMGGSEDLQYGKDTRTSGTFTTRLETLNITMGYISYYGLVWTGIGFAHSSQSAWVSTIFQVVGYWGTEMQTGQNLMAFGYYGVGIWYLIWLLMVIRIFKVSINAKNDFIFLFGVSLSIMLFVMFFVSSWASTSTNMLINITFLLAMFEKSYSIYEKDNLKTVNGDEKK